MQERKPGKTQRIVLITGSNRGIGLETARQLARRGFHVVIAARDEGRGRQAAEAIQARGGKATLLSLDVSSPDSIRGLTITSTASKIGCEGVGASNTLSE